MAKDLVENAAQHGTLCDDSTPHASPGNGEADQAGSCYFPLKPPLSYDEQLDRLLGRGLSLGSMSRQGACEWLGSCNYYRLRGYWMTLEDADGRFVEGATFQDVLDIMLLDKELRGLVFAMVGPIEIKLRTQLAYHLSLAYGPDAFERPEAFANETFHTASLRAMDREVELAKRGKVPCVLHNLKKYGRLPAWAAVETMSMGTASKLYGNLASKEVAADIAADFGVTTPYLKSWVEYLTQVRNICAHHNRFYNRLMVKRPRLHKAERKIDNAREFPVFYILFRLYAHSWPELGRTQLEELEGIIGRYPSVSMAPMGFPRDWQEVLGRVCGIAGHEDARGARANP